MWCPLCARRGGRQDIGVIQYLFWQGASPGLEMRKRRLRKDMIVPKSHSIKLQSQCSNPGLWGSIVHLLLESYTGRECCTGPGMLATEAGSTQELWQQGALVMSWLPRLPSFWLSIVLLSSHVQLPTHPLLEGRIARPDPLK